MKQPAVVHLLIGMVWMFLSGNPSLGGLATGLLAGFALLALFRRALNCADYIRRVTAASVHGWRFLGQILKSNLRIARLALRRDAGAVEGRFVRYRVGDLSEVELLLLCWFISLTPGTTVAERNDGELILHVFGLGEPDGIQSRLDQDLKNGILSFTR